MHRRKLWLFAGAVLLALALTATGSAKVRAGQSERQVGGHDRLRRRAGWRPRLVPQPAPHERLWRVLEQRVPDAGSARSLLDPPELHLQARPHQQVQAPAEPDAGHVLHPGERTLERQGPRHGQGLHLLVEGDHEPGAEGPRLAGRVRPDQEHHRNRQGREGHLPHAVRGLEGPLRRWLRAAGARTRGLEPGQRLD